MKSVMDPALAPLTAFQKRRQKVIYAVPIISDLVAQILIKSYTPDFEGFKTINWDKMAERYKNRRTAEITK